MAGNFSASIRQFADKTKQRALEVTEEVVTEMTATIIDRTPIDTGNAKDGWEIEQYEDGYRYRIFNKVPYIGVLEYGLFPNPPKEGTGKTVGGYSTQAPAGMVGITIAEFPQIVTRITRRG